MKIDTKILRVFLATKCISFREINRYKNELIKLVLLIFNILVLRRHICKQEPGSPLRGGEVRILAYVKAM